MTRLNVALISGGMSPEREVSLHGGEEVYQALNKDRYNVFRYDPLTDLGRLVEDAERLDVALVILHGVNGEDGTVQGLLDLLQVPYQCSGVLGSALAANKLATKRVFAQADLPTAPYVTATRHELSETGRLTDRINHLGLPLVIKPVSGGSSLGISIIQDTDQLAPALEKAFSFGDNIIIIESFITGRELTGAVIGNETPEALPVVEIIPGEAYPFFNYEAKYTPRATREICPAPIDAGLTKTVQEYACRAHQALFCKGCSRTDMIAADDGVYLLETNTIPGMVPTSLLPLAAGAAGIAFDELLNRLISLALEPLNPLF